MIEPLPSLIPDRTRSANTRARCHDRLERRRADTRAEARYTVERNTLLGFGALYLSSLAVHMILVFVR